MKRLIELYFITLVFAVGLLPTSVGYASQMQGLPMRELRYKSEGQNGSGVVDVVVIQGKKRLESISVIAFGHYQLIKQDLLKKISFEAKYNGITVSFEPGYRHMRGRVICLTLVAATPSRSVLEKTIIVCENGEIEIGAEIGSKIDRE